VEHAVLHRGLLPVHANQAGVGLITCFQSLVQSRASTPISRLIACFHVTNLTPGRDNPTRSRKREMDNQGTLSQIATCFGEVFQAGAYNRPF
jgi:hypothetical protein